MTNKLPQGWVECKLEDILIKLCNGTSKKQNKNASGVPVTRIETISDGVINFNRVGYISEISSEDIDTYKLICGDILFSNINSDFHLGKTAIYYGNELLLHGMNLLLIRLSKKIVLPSFINYYLNYCRFTGKFIKIAQHAVNQSSINQTKLKNFEIFLPPFNEQKRIVEKIEEEFGKIDEGVEKLKLAQEQIKQYRQSVLNQQFKIKHAETLTLNDVTTKINDGTHKTPTYVNVGIPFISVKDIKNKQIYFDDCKFITKEEHEVLYKRCNPEKGDVLITKSGTIGRTAVVDTDIIFDLFVSVALLKPQREKITSEFLMYTLDNYISHIDVKQDVKGGLIKNLHIEDIKKIKINLPTLDEQKQIVKEIEKRFKVADEVERVIAENLDKAEQLKQSILKKAFEGQLVPQDPTDQPASELLAQIKAERKK